MQSQRYIPFRKSELVKFCAKDDVFITTHSSAEFLQCARLLESLIHYQYYDSLERLKDLYAPVNPDLDTIPITSGRPKQPEPEEGFIELLESVLNSANYEKVTEEDVKHALKEESLFQIKLEVNFDDFEGFLLFYRGQSYRQESLKSFFGLRNRMVDFTNFDRVVLYIQFKDADYFAAQNRDELGFQPGSTIVKMFQNVPRADLEMLFPNTEVRMKRIDKLMIGVPAAVSGAVVLFTKLGGTLVLLAAFVAFWLGMREEEVVIDQAKLVALMIGLSSFAAVMWREFGKFKNRKLRFMKTLTDNLYYKNLGNNEGVIHRLLDSAEEEEVKEAMLAYFMLLRLEKPMSAAALDCAIEKWFVDELNTRLDFEIEDALRKLCDLGIVTGAENGEFRALTMADALQVMDDKWDRIYSY